MRKSIGGWVWDSGAQDLNIPQWQHGRLPSYNLEPPYVNPRYVVLEENPDLLISLSGLDYSFDLREVGEMLGVAKTR